MVRFVKGQIICRLTKFLSFCQFPRPDPEPFYLMEFQICISQDSLTLCQASQDTAIIYSLFHKLCSVKSINFSFPIILCKFLFGYSNCRTWRPCLATPHFRFFSYLSLGHQSKLYFLASFLNIDKFYTS